MNQKIMSIDVNPMIVSLKHHMFKFSFFDHHISNPNLQYKRKYGINIIKPRDHSIPLFPFFTDNFQEMLSLESKINQPLRGERW